MLLWIAVYGDFHSLPDPTLEKERGGENGRSRGVRRRE
jgi:hypothetical protein